MPCLFAAILALGIAHGHASARKSGPTAPPPPPPSSPPPEVALKVRLEVFARGLSEPVGLVYAPHDPHRRLFVVEKTGRVRVIERGQVQPGAFLDLSDRVSRGAEQGLLGLAFHPRWPGDPRFFVNYTDRRGDTRVVEFRGEAEPRTERELLYVDQPYANHNGGLLVFGPDGKLWIGLGDGGAAHDPHGHGQSRRSLLGKMLRLDVDASRPAPEIVQVGLRNPWRYSFDRKTSDLYVADVGQDAWEEVHVLPPSRQIGANLGWSIMEGRHCFRSRACDPRGLDLPVVEYGHDQGCSITGGHVYRGRAIPALEGAYFYADYCTGLLRSFRWRNGEVRDHWDWKRALDPKAKLSRLTAFGEDEDGELYLLSQDGIIYRFTPGAPRAAPP